jgi:glycosyltransferase involved in cell wall biosynthesis
MALQRIVYVLNIFPKLSETFIAGELAELRRRGVEVRILSLLPPREELRHDVIERAALDRLTEYEPAKFADVVREFQPDLLHAHFATDATAKAMELSALTGVPFTFTAHGYDIHRKPPPDFHRRAVAASALVTVSQANADYIERTFGVAREHLRVIPCGVDTERFCPMAKGNFRTGGETLPRFPANRQVCPTDAPLIVCVARLVAVKNLDLLLDACALLRGRGVKFRCALIGDGPLRAELEARRNALNLQEHVLMPGAVDQNGVVQWWQQAAVGVLTSQNEGMPVCLMEAAACGVPVVATSVGGIPELIENGVTGLLAPPDDAVSFAATLELLLNDEPFRARMKIAARLRAVERFSVTRQVDSLLQLWTGILSASKTAKTTPHINGAVRNIPVHDPFGAAHDADLPTLALALDPVLARHEFKRRLPRLSGEGRLRLKAIRVSRHKPSRRAVVEYDVEADQPGRPRFAATLIGKVRARRSGNEGLRQLESIWSAGFDAASADAISVPEPIGVISSFQMWFQRKVPGATAEALLCGPDGPALARRIAEAIHKLHGAGIRPDKSHSMADELRILRDCFDRVAALRPEWVHRLANLMARCEALAASVAAPAVCGIHRDFYPAQVIVDSSRLWLIDFDLYCLGDPGLDAGNFIGHVVEQALRERGDAQAFHEVERALEERFVELSGETVRQSVHAYAGLTLARHIFLSTRIPGRSHLTEPLLALCEARLGTA